MSGSSDNQQDSIKTDVGTKGIRLQGFKGFKLKGNCQLLIKSGLSQSQLKPSASLGDKIVLSPKQNVLKSPIQSPRKPINVSPQKLSNASPQKLSISSPQKLISASPSKTNIFEILSERNEPIVNEEVHKTKYSSPVKRSNESNAKTNSDNRRSRADEKRTKSSDSSSKETYFSSRSNRNRSRSRSADRSRQRWSHDDERTNRNRSPKRRRRSRSRERTFRKRERKSQRDYSRNSVDNQRTPNSDSKERVHSARKRRVSSSNSSDDDVIMRRGRERRRSPTKYSSRKKVKEVSSDEDVGKQTKPLVKVETSIKKDKIADLGVAKKSSSNDKPTKGDSGSKTTKHKAKSVVPLASIACWMGENDDDADDVIMTQQNERNVFDSFMPVTSQVKSPEHNQHNNIDSTHHNALNLGLSHNNNELQINNEDKYSNEEPVLKGISQEFSDPAYNIKEDDRLNCEIAETTKTDDFSSNEYCSNSAEDAMLSTNVDSPNPTLLNGGLEDHGNIPYLDETLDKEFKAAGFIVTEEAEPIDEPVDGEVDNQRGNDRIYAPAENQTNEAFDAVDSTTHTAIHIQPNIPDKLPSPTEAPSAIPIPPTHPLTPHSITNPVKDHPPTNLNDQLPPSPILTPNNDIISPTIPLDSSVSLTTSPMKPPHDEIDPTNLNMAGPVYNITHKPTIIDGEAKDDNSDHNSSEIPFETPLCESDPPTPPLTSENHKDPSPKSLISALPAKKRWFKAHPNVETSSNDCDQTIHHSATDDATMTQADIPQDLDVVGTPNLFNPPELKQTPLQNPVSPLTHENNNPQNPETSPILAPEHQKYPYYPVESPPHPPTPPNYAPSSPESPLFSPGSESPCIAPEMTAFDDGSSGTEDICDTIEIRIPIDDAGTHMNENSVAPQVDMPPTIVTEPTKPIVTHNDAIVVNNDDPLVEATSDETSNSALDESAEGRRRSARIMTKMKKRKPRFWPQEGQDSPTIDTTNQEPLDVPEQNAAIETSPSFNADTVNTASDLKFEAIVENVYLCEKKKSRVRKEIRRMVCECASNEGGTPCGSDCLNRLLMIECSSRCPLEDQCQNKRFQRRQYVPTEVFRTDWKGLGIKALTDLGPDMLVMEYCGEVIDTNEFARRSMIYSRDNQQHFYFMALSQDEIIDATLKGNTSRFINHSCDPNCETQKWTVNGRLRVGFFTLRNISKGEEITFDYQFERYGKEAQACFCGSTNCRGYLGKAPDEDDDVTTDDVTADDDITDDVIQAKSEVAESTAVATESSKKKKKKKETFKDNSLEREVFSLRSGLQTTKEVLVLSRSMVKSETLEHRLLCLKVLRRTDNQACLRSFLQLHGLPLLWSWMVDLTSSPHINDITSYFRLKLEILSVLSMLPITSLNILQDSKVISMVRRWAEEDPPTILPTESESETKVDENSVEPQTSDKVDVDSGEDKAENVETVEVPNPALKDDPPQEEGNTPDKLGDLSSEVVEASENLLASWKDLKEIYRIPKRQQSVDPTLGGESERSVEERSSSQTSSPSVANQMDGNTGYYEEERHREYSSEKDWRGREDNWGSRRSPPRGRRDNESKSSRNSSDGGKYAWLNEKPSRLSREEHRRQFERGVKHREGRGARKRWDIRTTTAGSTGIWPLPAPTVTSLGIPFQSGVPTPLPPPQVLYQPTLSTPHVSTTPQTPGTFTPSGYSGNLIQINPQPPPTVLQPNPIFTGIPQTPNHSGQGLLPIPSLLPNDNITQSINVVGGMHQQPGLAQANYAQNMTQQVMQPSQQLMTQQINPQVNLPPTQPAASNNPGVTILGSQGGQAIVLLSAEQLQQLSGQKNGIATPQAPTPAPQVTPQTQPQPMDIQSQLQQLQLQQQFLQEQNMIQQQMLQIQLQPPTVQTQMLQQNLQARLQQIQLQQQTSQQQHHITQQPPQPAEPVAPIASQSAFNPHSSPTPEPPKVASPPRDPRPPRLPPNWKSATDTDGCVYYYHAITRKTQWDIPTWDSVEEDPTKPSDTKVAATDPRLKANNGGVGNVTEEAKKAREIFRSKMSQHVVHCLNSYRKSDCQVGRITSTDDFKKLARKLTYNILMKEIKQVIVWDDLEYNANVKHKAKEYVKKYMAKMGPIYKAKDDD